MNVDTDPEIIWARRVDACPIHAWLKDGYGLDFYFSGDDEQTRALQELLLLRSELPEGHIADAESSRLHANEWAVLQPFLLNERWIPIRDAYKRIVTDWERRLQDDQA